MTKGREVAWIWYSQGTQKSPKFSRRHLYIAPLRRRGRYVLQETVSHSARCCRCIAECVAAAAPVVVVPDNFHSGGDGDCDERCGQLSEKGTDRPFVVAGPRCAVQVFWADTPLSFFCRPLTLAQTFFIAPPYRCCNAMASVINAIGTAVMRKPKIVK